MDNNKTLSDKTLNIHSLTDIEDLLLLFGLKQLNRNIFLISPGRVCFNIK